ncbi:MAG: sialidase family protein [Planctomycetota bacterium]|nr:sialidase family protein [Planctomycetota bacterium]
MMFCACPAAALAQITYTVGPPSAGACGGSDCDYQSIQSAIDAATAGDTVTAYRRTDDAANNECYNEHITINKANLTVQGASTTPASAACIGPSTQGDMVTITASGVTLKNLEISGKANDGAAGLSLMNLGGRHLGAGVRIIGNDVDDVIIENCTIAFTRDEQVRWQGDQDGDNNGNVTIRKCYMHHSDIPRANIRIDGGSNATETHVVEDNYLTTGQGIFSDAEYITVQRNIVEGWPYWGHLVSDSTWPETHDYAGGQATYGGGWRYFSRCAEGIYVQNGGAGTDIKILNNLVFGTQIGIRVQTSGTITNNTVVNPFNVPPDYDFDGAIDATKIRNATYGIMLVSGFSGTLTNNIVVVTDDNRATGNPGKATTPYYSPGITGYGIGFSGGSGSLGAGASVTNNNVWGFVDTNGSTATNWGGGLSTCEDNSDSKCSANINQDPLFATDTSDETNDGAGGCDADIDNTRCYELYADNFFLSSVRATGTCHADIRPNTAAAVGFVDMTSTTDLSGLGDCTYAADGTTSPLIDWGTGAVAKEPSSNGGIPNLGAFGNTDRGSKSDLLRITGITIGDGAVKSVSGSPVDGYSGPGVIQARSGGLTLVRITFNREISATSSSFTVRDNCDDSDVTAPTFDFTEVAAPNLRVTLTWPASTHVDRWVRIKALGDDPVNKITDTAGEALDGEISNVFDGTLPSGDGTVGGDADFCVGTLVGDVDGDRTVEGGSGENDRVDVETYPGYPSGTCATCPEDVNGDGNVNPTDRGLVAGNDNEELLTIDTCPPVEIWDNGASVFTPTLADGDPIDINTNANAFSPAIAVNSQNQIYIPHTKVAAGKARLYLTRYDGTDVKIWDNGASTWTDTFADGDNVDTGANQAVTEPAIAIDTGDNVYVPFVQSTHVYLTRYDGTDVKIWDNGGSAWTDTFGNGDPIDNNSAADASSPVVATDSSNRVYVAFLQEISNESRLYLSRYDGTDVKIWDNGASAWTDTFGNGDTIDTGASEIVGEPAIVVDSSDRVYIAFRQSDGSNTHIYLARYDGTDVKIWDNGASAWTDTFTDADPIDTGSSNNASEPVIVRDGSDNVYIAFTQSDGSNNHIYVSRYDGTDVKIWDNGASTWTDTFSNGDPIDTGSSNNAGEPAIVRDGSNRVYVTYKQSNGSNDHIYLSRYDGTDVEIWDNGVSAWTDTFTDGDPIDTGSANDASMPVIDVDATERVYVAYKQSDGSNMHVYFSRWDTLDVKAWDHNSLGWTDTFSLADPIDTATANAADTPVLAVDGLERVFVTYIQFSGAKQYLYLSKY